MNNQQEQVVEMNVQDYKKIGDEFYEKREYDEALQAYDKALEITPDNAAVLNNKGRVFYVQRKHQEALTLFRQALSLDSTHSEVYYYNIGLTLEKISQYEEALKAYTQALLIHPLYEYALDRKMSILALYLERDEELVTFCDEILALDQKNEDALTEKAIALNRLHRYEAALQAYNEALRHYPQSKSKKYHSTYVSHNRNMLLREMKQLHKIIM